MPPFQRRPPRCLARNCLTVRQFGPLESIDPNDAMILPHGANPDRMKFSERTGIETDVQSLSAAWKATLKVNCPVSVPKTRFCNNGDEGRRGRAQLRCGPHAGWRDGPARPCQETDESSTRCNRRHTSSEFDVSAATRCAPQVCSLAVSVSGKRDFGAREKCAETTCRL